MSKAFICSIPKSGTYLVAEVLKLLGLRDSGLHIGTHEFANYGAADLETGRRHPKSLLVQEPIEQSIKRINDGEFAVGHLPMETAHLLDEFNVIFLCRNIRDVLISMCRWRAATGRNPDQVNWCDLPDGPDKLLGFLEQRGEEMRAYLALPTGWVQVATAVPIKFESLMGGNGQMSQCEMLRRLCDVTGMGLTYEELGSILKQALANDTLTKSTGRCWRADWWNELVEAEYERLGLHEINRQLGYA